VAVGEWRGFFDKNNDNKLERRFLRVRHGKGSTKRRGS